jgi:hypothetical protein
MKPGPDDYTSGIFREGSHLRIHVSAWGLKAYLFATESARRLLRRYSGSWDDRPSGMGFVTATQPGCQGEATSRGFVVPPRLIPGVRVLSFPEAWLGDVRDESHGSLKARAAEGIARRLLEGPLTPDGTIVQDVSLQDQLRGIDLALFLPGRSSPITVQVKMDYRGGEGDALASWVPATHARAVVVRPLCTGRLYLECWEQNPLRVY